MHKKKITPTGALLYVFLTVVLVFMMIPFVWLLISSLRPNADLFNEPFAVPKTLSFENFRAVMESHPMLLYFANSVAILLWIFTKKFHNDNICNTNTRKN